MMRLGSFKRIIACVVLVVTGVIFLFAILIFGLFYATIPIHNLSLWRMERALSSSISHPADTSAIEQFSFFGSRYTDMSECTYVAGEFRSASLSREALRAMYENATVDLLGFVRRMPVRVVIADNDTSLPLNEPAGDWIYDFVQRIDTRSSHTTYYLVYLYEKSRSPWGDYRCFE